MSSVTAVLVTYNSAGVIASALRSIVSEPNVTRIIMVDNASVDETVQLVARLFPNVEIIRNTENLGFGAANNIALEKVKTEFALLMNPDVMMDPRSVSKLLEAATEFPEAGILAPVLLDENRVPYANFNRAYFNRSYFNRKSKEALTIPEAPACAEFLSGAVWLVRMSTLQVTGRFDPHLFFYFEDDDLCLRMRKAGFSLIITPQAHAMHGMGKSSGEDTHDKRMFRLYHFSRGRLYLEKKHAGKAAGTRMALWWGVRSGVSYLAGLCFFILPWKYRYRARFAAVCDYFWPQQRD